MIAVLLISFQRVLLSCAEIIRDRYKIDPVFPRRFEVNFIVSRRVDVVSVFSYDFCTSAEQHSSRSVKKSTTLQQRNSPSSAMSSWTRGFNPETLAFFIGVPKATLKSRKKNNSDSPCTARWVGLLPRDLLNLCDISEISDDSEFAIGSSGSGESKAVYACRGSTPSERSISVLTRNRLSSTLALPALAVTNAKRNGYLEASVATDEFRGKVKTCCPKPKWRSHQL